MLDPQTSKLITQLRKEAISLFEKQDPNLSPMLAGMSLSNGGDAKIIGLLDQQFSLFLEASRKMPQEFTLNFHPQDVIDTLTKAQFYLFADQFRPTGGVAILPGARAKKKEFNDTMDQRLMIVALEIQRCKTLLEA
jgi:hypothetical protein